MIAACPATPVNTNPLPRSGGLVLPWVKAAPARSRVYGLLFAFDRDVSGLPPRLTLWAGGAAPPPGPAQKILWVVRRPGFTGRLTLRGTLLGGTETFTQTFQRVYSATPTGALYASIVNAPHSGCWKLDVSSGSATGFVVVQVVVQ